MKLWRMEYVEFIVLERTIVVRLLEIELKIIKGLGLRLAFRIKRKFVIIK